jgi:hypothetical protein
MPIKDFYRTDGEAMFIDKMTTFLGIPANKLKIVSVIEGSVIIDYEVVLDDETKSSKTFKEIIETNTESTQDSAQLGQQCGAVTTGISKGIADGTLNFGAPVSRLSYTCTEVIDSDLKFNATSVDSTETKKVMKGEILFTKDGKIKGQEETTTTEEVKKETETSTPSDSN